jgi:membrane protein DedA with SNARE-associated domain
VFTIAAGVFKVPLSTLVMASLLSRAGRFFLVGGLIRLFGASMKGYIERYFNWLSIAFVVLLVLGFVVARWVVH